VRLQSGPLEGTAWQSATHSQFEGEALSGAGGVLGPSGAIQAIAALAGSLARSLRLLAGVDGKPYLASVRSFSTCWALMAPGTREPSTKKRVGVPVILRFFPNSRLRSRTVVSQLALGTG